MTTSGISLTDGIRVGELVAREAQLNTDRINDLELRNIVLQRQADGLMRTVNIYAAQRIEMNHLEEMRTRLKGVLSDLLALSSSSKRARPEEVVGIYEIRLKEMLEQVTGSSVSRKSLRTVESASPSGASSDPSENEASPERLEEVLTDQENEAFSEEALPSTETVSGVADKEVPLRKRPARNPKSADSNIRRKKSNKSLPPLRQTALAQKIIQLSAQFFNVDMGQVKTRHSDSYLYSIHICRMLDLQWRLVSGAYGVGFTHLCTDSVKFKKRVENEKRLQVIVENLIDYLHGQKFEQSLELQKNISLVLLPKPY